MIKILANDVPVSQLFSETVDELYAKNPYEEKYDETGIVAVMGMLPVVNALIERLVFTKFIEDYNLDCSPPIDGDNFGLVCAQAVKDSHTCSDKFRVRGNILEIPAISTKSYGSGGNFSELLSRAGINTRSITYLHPISVPEVDNRFYSGYAKDTFNSIQEFVKEYLTDPSKRNPIKITYNMKDLRDIFDREPATYKVGLFAKYDANPADYLDLIEDVTLNLYPKYDSVSFSTSDLTVPRQEPYYVDNKPLPVSILTYQNFDENVIQVFCNRLLVSSAEQITYNVKIDEEQAKYVTQEDKPKPTSILKWAKQYATYYASNKSGYTFSSAINVVPKLNAIASRLPTKPFFNKDRLTTTSEGEFIFVPEVEGLDTYEADLEKVSNRGEYYTFNTGFEDKHNIEEVDTTYTVSDLDEFIQLVTKVTRDYCNLNGINSYSIDYFSTSASDTETYIKELKDYVSKNADLMSKVDSHKRVDTIIAEYAVVTISKIVKGAQDAYIRTAFPQICKACNSIASKLPEELSIGKAPVKLPHNKFLAIDNLSKKLIYIDYKGAENFVDLEGSRPTTDEHIVNTFKRVIIGKDNDCSQNFTSSINFLLSTYGKSLSILNDYPSVDNDPFGLLEIVTTLGKVSNRYSNEYTQRDVITTFLRHLRNGNIYAFLLAFFSLSEDIESAFSIESNEATLNSSPRLVASAFSKLPTSIDATYLSKDSHVSILSMVGHVIEEIKKAQEWTFDTLSTEGSSIPIRLSQCAWSYVILNYLPGLHNTHKTLQALKESKLKPVETPPTDLGPISHVKGLVQTPHQGRIRNELSVIPDNVILPVDTGGGKTIICLTDVLDRITDGTVKRPLIMCPEHLVKDYVKEANYLTNGSLNVIPLTSTTYKNYGVEGLTALLRAAPVNSVAVTSYDFVSNGTRKIDLFNTETTVNEHVVFLQNIDFDGVWLDESHFLRNASSRRTSAALSLVSGIPLKREMSGTFNVNNLLDTVNQVSILDPTIFGSESDFTEEYAAEMAGNKIVRWKLGAERLIKNQVKTNVKVVEAKFKEWAALLPPSKTEYHFVKLSKAQQIAYEAIVDKTIEEIKKNDEELFKLLQTGDEEQADKLQFMLNPYLARIEQFLSAPGKDELGAELLKDADIVSPKASTVAKITKKHLADKIPGKILVFTSYKESARQVYENLPNDIRNKAVYYTADRKVECEAEFRTNPDKIIMIGVEHSMNTGLNLQFCSRLIRIESVWSPGTLEQGQRRIERPNIKTKEFRTGLYFDWIVVDNTIDVTKISRLISKTVSLSLYSNADNRLYDSLVTPYLVPMTLDSLRANNSFEGTMGDHFKALKDLQSCVQKDLEEFKNNTSIDKKPIAVPDGKFLKGAKLLSHVPYAPGIDIYDSEEVGLEAVQEFIANNGEEALLDKSVHTEYGDCVVKRINKNTLSVVSLFSGVRHAVHKHSAWVIEKVYDNQTSIKEQLAKIVGLPLQSSAEELLQDYQTDKGVKPKVIKDEKTPIPNTTETEPDNVLNLYPTVLNNNLLLVIDADDPDAHLEVLKKYGFIKSNISNYAYAEVRLAKHLRGVINGLVKHFTIAKTYIDTLEELEEVFTEGRSKLLNVKRASILEYRDFMKMRVKACTGKEVRPFPLLQDGSLYVMFDADKCPAVNKLQAKIKVPGVRWEFAEMPYYGRYCMSKRELKEVVKAMQADGIVIGNFEELKQEVALIKLM